EERSSHPASPLGRHRAHRADAAYRTEQREEQVERIDRAVAERAGPLTEVPGWIRLDAKVPTAPGRRGRVGPERSPDLATMDEVTDPFEQRVECLAGRGHQPDPGPADLSLQLARLLQRLRHRLLDVNVLSGS